MIISKPAVGEHKAKLLFLMGATWFNKSMFDLDTIEDSFSTCLNKQGIETYTFDIFGSSFGNDTGFVGARHDDNVQLALQTVKDYDIDYVMGYSYGCFAAKRVAEELDIKGLIFLDPRASISSSRVLTNNDDLYTFSKSNFAKDIIKNGGNVKEEILKDHINSLTDKDTFTSPAYPVKSTSQERLDFVNQEKLNVLLNKCNTTAIFTKNSVESVRSMYPNSSKIYYPDASHWIMIEDHRFKLAEDISNLITFSVK